jgi:hypothetical protein
MEFLLLSEGTLFLSILGIEDPEEESSIPWGFPEAFFVG